MLVRSFSMAEWHLLKTKIWRGSWFISHTRKHDLQFWLDSVIIFSFVIFFLLRDKDLTTTLFIDHLCWRKDLDWRNIEKNKVFTFFKVHTYRDKNNNDKTKLFPQSWRMFQIRHEKLFLNFGNFLCWSNPLSISLKQKDKYKRKKFFNFYLIFSSERFSPNRKSYCFKKYRKSWFWNKKKIVIISKNLDW
jgi:hypothetical protein